MEGKVKVYDRQRNDNSSQKPATQQTRGGGRGRGDRGGARGRGDRGRGERGRGAKRGQSNQASQKDTSAEKNKQRGDANKISRGETPSIVMKRVLCQTFYKNVLTKSYCSD